MPFPYICSGNNFPFSESGLPPYTTDATKPESKNTTQRYEKGKILPNKLRNILPPINNYWQILPQNGKTFTNFKNYEYFCGTYYQNLRGLR